MEFDCLITLIDKVSSSELKSFELEEGDLKISMKKQEKKLSISGEAEGSAIELPVQPQAEIKTLPEGKQVKAPLVGTFYNAPSPDAEPYVKAGDRVQKGQILGIIEAMKLMNEIESEYDGVVEEILAANEQMVEYGQPLFLIK
jgi:acetyl-CoA carboxylase biotin carboxyl carrier protein